MNPICMTLLLVAGWGVFAYSARRRWKLMMVGASESRFDRPGERLRLTIRYALAQLRMRRYPLAGFAHMLIFTGFVVLLLRSLILWGRGYDESFNFWLFSPLTYTGQTYSFFKDFFAVLVILGTLVFVYYRVVKRLSRCQASFAHDAEHRRARYPRHYCRHDGRRHSLRRGIVGPACSWRTRSRIPGTHSHAESALPLVVGFDNHLENAERDYDAGESTR